MLTAQPIRSASYPAVSRQARAPVFAVCETGPANAPKLKLLDRVRGAIRVRHSSRRTEKAYAAWMRRYIFFPGKRPHHLPVVLTRGEVGAALAEIHGGPSLMTIPLCGARLRLLECARLRVQDIDIARRQIAARSGRRSGSA